MNMTPAQLEASNLLTEIFLRFNSRTAAVLSFRIVASYGVRYAVRKVEANSSDFAKKLCSDPEFEGLFTNRSSFFENIGGVDGLAGLMTARTVEDFEKAVDAASLVFTHSILDDASLGYCRVAAIVSPQDWEKFVIKKQISLEDVKSVKASSFEEILKNKVFEYIDKDLENQSLLFKVDRLYEICQPPTDFSGIKDYKFDRDHLKKLDDLRHDIVHGEGPVKKLPNGERDIEYLQKTTIHLLTLVNFKYDVKINPLGLPKFFKS